MSNNIADNSRAILAAIGTGNAAIIAADQSAHLVNQKTTGDASIANLKATYDAQVAGINATNLGTVSTAKAVTDSSATNANITNITSVATQKAISDASLANALAFGEVRNNIAEQATATALAAKDIQIAIFKDGSHTREETQEAICDLAKDTAKGFADAALKACEDRAALAAQIAECCCEQKLLTIQQGNDTRALILAEGQKRLEAENADLRI